jgi:hypothetical protein
MQGKWYAPTFYRPRCGSNRVDRAGSTPGVGDASEEVVMRLFYQSFGVSRGSRDGAYDQVLKRIVDSAASPGTEISITAVSRTGRSCALA